MLWMAAAASLIGKAAESGGSSSASQGPTRFGDSRFDNSGFSVNTGGAATSTTLVLGLVAVGIVALIMLTRKK